MTHALTFPRGGILLPSREPENRPSPIVNAALPPVAVVPLRRAGGSVVECLVGPGDRVAEGELIGRPRDRQSAPVHAPIPGLVVAVREALLGDGRTGSAAVIELGGAFAQSGRPRPPRSWEVLDPQQLIAVVADAGVALDGRQEPLAERLAAARARSARVLVANAIESEPWLSAERRLLAERPGEVAEGLRIAKAATGCTRVVLAVTADSVAAAEGAAAAFRGGLEVAVFERRYPQEEESRIAAALFGPASARGRGALEGGAAVIGISSLVALREAVALGRPCLERVVTVAGSALREPRNLKVRVGTRAGDLVEEAGGLAAQPAAVVFGGAMRAHAFDGGSDWRGIPVAREVPAILLLSRRDLATGRERPCLRCGRCLDACPWGLAPARLGGLVGSAGLVRASAEGLGECTACGCCSYVCPSRIPLAARLREARDRLVGVAS